MNKVWCNNHMNKIRICNISNTKFNNQLALAIARRVIKRCKEASTQKMFIKEY